MKKLGKKTRSNLITYLIVIVAFLVCQLAQSGLIDGFKMTRSLRGQLIPICVYIVMAVSLNLTVGISGELSLGHAGFMSVGAFSGIVMATWLSEGMGVQNELACLLAAIAFGGLVAGLAGVLIGIPVLRLRGDYLAIVTLAFGEIVRALLRLIQPIGGARGMIGIPNYANFFWIMLFVVLTLWLLRNLIYSPYGRAFIAIRDNEIAADAMGINTTKYKIMSFCIAAFIAGVAGGLYAHVLSFIQPDSFSFTKSSDFLVYLYAGGSGSLTGSVIGAVLLTILPEVLRFLADWRLVLYALILVVVMLYRSEGLCGGKEVPFLRIKRSSLYEQPLFGRKKNDTSKK